MILGKAAFNVYKTSVKSPYCVIFFSFQDCLLPVLTESFGQKKKNIVLFLEGAFYATQVCQHFALFSIPILLV